MSRYAEILDLPALPSQFLPDWQQLSAQDNLNELARHDIRYITDQGIAKPCGIHLRWPANDATLHDWLKTNITEDWSEINWRTTGSPRHGAHMDQTRFYSLQYMIDPGGSQAATIFWLPKHNQCRMNRGTNHFDHYDDLEEILRVAQQPGQWMLIDGRQIHGVEGIQGSRRFFSMSFMIKPVF